jgi:hypothetical protein
MTQPPAQRESLSESQSFSARVCVVWDFCVHLKLDFGVIGYRGSDEFI